MKRGLLNDEEILNIDRTTFSCGKMYASWGKLPYF